MMDHVNRLNHALRPPCPLCGAKMILGTHGHYRCITHQNHPSAILKRIAIVLFVISAALMLGLFAGCTTVTAPKLKDTQASFDGTEQNSGFVGFDSQRYGIITTHAVDRYNALATIYGGYFVPPVQPGDGLHDVLTAETQWRIDPQHLVYFMTMQRWKKENKPPWTAGK